jgi:pimeloyl-ACP methyl ester carboxylesterase
MSLSDRVQDRQEKHALWSAHVPPDLIAGDGTRLRAWRNASDTGAKVLVCNGMGVPPEAWPRLLDDDCDYQVAGWNHRGVLGSDRPADPARVEIEDHVADAVALMDELGWDSAVVVAWSLGVNVAFELAREHPDRVAGLLSVAGVPGGTFDTILSPQFVPRPLRKPVGLGVAHLGRRIGPQLNLLSRVVPKNRAFAEAFRHSGIMFPYGDIDDVLPWVQTFFAQDFEYYFELAIALARHDRIDPSFIEAPVTIVAGVLDALTAHSDIMDYAAQIPHAEVHSLPGSHCIPLEFPDRVMDLLRDVVVQAQWRDGARSGGPAAGGPGPRTGRPDPEPVIDLRAGAAAELSAEAT